MRKMYLYVSIFLVSAGLVGCSFVEDGSNDTDRSGTTSGPFDSTGLALTADNLGDTDVERVRFVVSEIDCDTEASLNSVQTETVDFEDMHLPGGIDEFEGKPYDKDSKHLFADHYFTVDAGCYEAATEPLTTNGAPSEDCSGASKTGIEVLDGKTTEIMLVNQCTGPERGGFDVAGSINHPPEINDLEFGDSKFITSCQPFTEVCVNASDPDNDPLQFSWTTRDDVPKRGSIRSVGSPTQDQQTGNWESCAEVATSQIGKHGFNVRVHDMDGNGKTMEEVVRQQKGANGQESRDELSFPMYAMTACQGRTASILMSMNNDPGLENAGYARRLIAQAAEWVSPLTDSTTGEMLVVQDNNHQNEHPNEDTFITTQLNGTYGSVDRITEPAGGLSASDLDGYDAVWFSNPGYPMDDPDTYDVLEDYRADGNGVILQGDDIAGPPLTGSRDLSFFTNLDYQGNGVTTCGDQTNNNVGNNYTVEFDTDPISILDGLRAESFEYGNDIDHTTRLNAGENVLAEASYSSGNCSETFPAITAVDPVDIP